VVKRTEALFGSASFKGISLPDGTSLFKAPAPPNRRLEFIGDSILCGYGVEASSAQCDSLRPYENADKAFGALLAHDLGAEYRLEAFSGKGVIRNWGDKQSRSSDPFPPFFTQTLCGDPKSVWDFTKWTPHAVIIHLGLNDFSTAPEADPKEFTKAYIELLKQVRDKYPKAVIFCAAPLGVYNLSFLLDKIVEKRNSAGDKSVILLTYPPAPANLFGCDGHPNAMAQRQMADTMLTAIQEALYW
jgi:lysophospholipase L1-like esterase